MSKLLRQHNEQYLHKQVTQLQHAAGHAHSRPDAQPGRPHPSAVTTGAGGGVAAGWGLGLAGACLPRLDRLPCRLCREGRPLGSPHQAAHAAGQGASWHQADRALQGLHSKLLCYRC